MVGKFLYKFRGYFISYFIMAWCVIFLENIIDLMAIIIRIT